MDQCLLRNFTFRIEEGLPADEDQCCIFVDLILQQAIALAQNALDAVALYSAAKLLARRKANLPGERSRAQDVEHELAICKGLATTVYGLKFRPLAKYFLLRQIQCAASLS